MSQSESPWTTFSTADGLPSMDVYSIAAHKGEVWIGMDGGVTRLEPSNSSWVSMNPPGLTTRVTCISMGGGSVWFGTYGDGLLRYTSGDWSSYTKDDGLPDNRVEDVEFFEDSLYVATAGGASRMTPGGQAPSFTNVRKAEGLPEEGLTAVSVLGDTVWYGSKANGILGLDPVSHVYTSQITIADGLSDSRILALDSDEQYLWIGTGAGGLCRYDPESGEVVRYNKSVGLADNLVSCVASNTKVWTGSWGYGATSIDSSGTLRIYGRPDGLSSGDIRGISIDGGYVWFATVGGGSPQTGGVTRFRGEESERGTEKIPMIHIILAAAIVGSVAVLAILKRRPDVEKTAPRKRKLPYQICKGKPSEELCPFCKYNVVKEGKNHCAKYHIDIVFGEPSL